MTDLTLLSSKSPFDSIRQVRPDGSEFWSARDLMSVMGYGAWREFRVPIDRAMKSAANQGHDVSGNFGGSTKISSTKPAEDFELSRFAAYLVAMNGDPNKPEVAAAQSYFAIRTREAEVSPKPTLEGEELLAVAVLEAAATIKRIDGERKQLAAKVEHDAPLVAKAEAHSASTKSVHRQEFAREVQAWGKKIHGIRILQAHVFSFLTHRGMTIGGERSDTGHATAHAVASGWAWTDKGTSEDGYPYATTRLLPKGQDIAWKWITKHVEANGTLELPRAIGPAA
ncbi:phage antirepressor KilAC domain-containing protein [Rhodococcus sp. T9N]|uniref:phage antirepressor KilAC domain-containing protein n=1 Tax=Rhodococcus sp. T9N TaxID=627445 RepID=UPI0021C3543D|nr:phage antirepressor KilAC domain-containing protein [Rhodococcus sp. T9N]